MSVLVLGLSHRSAPITVLERSRSTPTGPPGWPARSAAARTSVRRSSSRPATGSRSTPTPRPSTARVTEIGDALAAAAGVPLAELREHLYVHYEDRAIAHAFSVACGLDSMAVGEGADPRPAARRAARGPGRRAGRRRAQRRCSSRRCGSASAPTPRPGSTASACPWSSPGSSTPRARSARSRARRVLVVGAGSMSSLAATTVSRLGARDLVIINRTLDKAERLAAATEGRALPFEALDEALAEADLVISCTGAVGHVVGAAAVAAAVAVRGRPPQVYVDLALPRDVDPAVAAAARRRGLSVWRTRRRRSAAAGESTPHLKAAQDLVGRGGRGLPHRASRAGRRPDRGRAALPGRRRRRRRDGPAGAAAALLDEQTRAEVAPPCTGWSRSCCTPRPSG